MVARLRGVRSEVQAAFSASLVADGSASVDRSSDGWADCGGVNVYDGLFPRTFGCAVRGEIAE